MNAMDAVVVGAGPNGLVAAAELAEAGLKVAVYEAADAPGGGVRTEALTLPGFLHDTYSAVYPLAPASPAFKRLGLEEHGLEWIHPQVPMAHPRLDGSAAVLARSIDETVATLGVDEARYRKLVEPFSGKWNELTGDALAPLTMHVPDHPLLLSRFGIPGLLPADVMTRLFKEPQTQAMLAGLAAHTIAPLSQPFTFGIGLLFMIAAHEVGWPIPKGGAQAITDAMVSCLQSRNVDIVLDHRVRSMDDLPPARAYVFDLTPDQLADIAGDRLAGKYTQRLWKYRRGPAVYKVDYALDGPVPWTADACRRAGTVHLGDSYEHIAAALRSVNNHEFPRTPFVIAAQPSIVDPSRAPDGKHVLWAYAHVPHGYTGDPADIIENHIEKYAPGFRSLVLARSALTPAQLEQRNPNMVGGDIAGGSFTGMQTIFRPTLSRVPYATANPSIYICSSSTPPGPGVHGMCGLHAARTVLRRSFGTRSA
jgi:phytoene dehydrogenase-like protein